MVAAGAALGQTPPARSGLDLAALDASVRPQDDLYRYVNGRWLATVKIPPDRVSFGTFVELQDRAAADVQAIIEEMGRDGRPSGSVKQVLDFYRSATDEAALDRLGASPIQPQLTAIEAVASPSQLASEAGRLSALGQGGPFGVTVGADPRDPGSTVVEIAPGGTLLPDLDSYLSGDARLAVIRGRYQEYLERMLGLTQHAEPAQRAREVLALETELARAQWEPTEALGERAVLTLSQLSARMPGFDWRAWAKPQGIDRVDRLALQRPSFFERFASLVSTTPLPVWKAWLAARLATAAAPYLDKRFDDARYEFFGRTLTGQEKPRPRWTRAVSLVNVYLGDTVGRPYAETRLSPGAIRRMQQLSANILAAFRRRVAAASWATAPTRAVAALKLRHLEAEIGRPASWHEYGELRIQADDLLGNVRRSLQYASGADGRTQAATARGCWPLPPQTPSAFYSPTLNRVFIPAAVLLPPLFDPDADDAANYGGIGAIVAHEIAHALDESGRLYDAGGAARDWWRPAELVEFRRRAAALARQFGAGGERTLRENVADLVGLDIALQAYRLSRAGGPDSVKDGFTGEQRFFMSWARTWRSKTRPEYVRQSELESRYATSDLRTNLVASNVDGFAEAFSLRPGDRLYRPPEQRVRIW